MKKVFILALVLMSSKVFAIPSTHCVRGGAVAANLPSNAYYLYIIGSSPDVLTLSIFEKDSAGYRGDLILKKSVRLQSFDQERLRKSYVTNDGRTSLTTNENRDGDILSAFISGTGEGVNPNRPFSFESRSCGRN